MAQKNAPAAIPTPVPATLSKPTPVEVPNPIEIGSAPVSSSSRSRLLLSVGGGALIPAMFLLVMVLFLAGREGQRNSMGNVVTPLKIVGEWDALGSDPRSDRIEILRLEDQAIGRGDRNALQALQSLCQSLDPSCRKYVAIQASLIRIQQAYRLRKEVPDERLDAGEFLSDTDLPLSELTDVLGDAELSPGKRRRAAFLLADAEDTRAHTALYGAIQEDPDLDVAWQAFLSFRQLTGYPSWDFGNADALSTWWTQNFSKFRTIRSPLPFDGEESEESMVARVIEWSDL